MQPCINFPIVLRQVLFQNCSFARLSKVVLNAPNKERERAREGGKERKRGSEREREEGMGVQRESEKIDKKSVWKIFYIYTPRHCQSLGNVVHVRCMFDLNYQ